MGGELNLGVHNDNLVFTDFITKLWSSRNNNFNDIPDLLKQRFIQYEKIDLEELKNQLLELDSLNTHFSKKRQFKRI